jgi:hypothetical protein
MFALVSLAASAAVSSTGYGVTYGPGAGGFNTVRLHEGAQVNGAAYYWQPKPASDLMSTTRQVLQKLASGCNGNFLGGDCSLKMCPYGLSSNTSPSLKIVSGDTPEESFAPTSRISECELVAGACDPSTFLGDTDAFLGTHTYAECSAQGVCDRATGVCGCFDGFTGVGCRYTTCPNDCSGHGVCTQNAHANTDYDTPDSALYFGTQFWDAYKTMRCVCDRGYSGYDCTERICPRGDDILTTCATAVADVQMITLAFDSDIANFEEKSKFFTLTFIDGFNGAYNTSPIAVMEDPTITAALTQTALESLPNDALPSVQVSGTQVGDTQTLSITFSDIAISGIQKDLRCNVRHTSEVCTAGQQPFIDADVTETEFVCTNIGHAQADETQFEENAECGNRGICDKATGKCACFEGHAGEACSIYSVYV